MNDEEKGNYDADYDAHFDVPDYREEEGERHEREIDPCTHSKLCTGCQ